MQIKMINMLEIMKNPYNSVHHSNSVQILYAIRKRAKNL